MKQLGGLRTKGFTIVELLIVIVIIAVLAALAVGSFNGIKDRGNKSKIEADLTMLQKAITAARVAEGEVATRFITNSTATAANCVNTLASVDLADKTAAASCWASYDSAMDKISTASNMNIRGLVDPWGRPYFLDENEKEGATQCGLGKDGIGAYPQPRTQGSWGTTNTRNVSYVTSGC